MAREDKAWVHIAGYFKTNGGSAGVDILIAGSSHYLNFGTLSGTTGYGFRDNAGTMQVKNSGGAWANFGSGGSGITGVAVASSNGFTGTSDGDPTTPTLTLTTSITGLLKGNGTAISAATVGTDYVTGSSTNTFTNKTYDTAGTGNSFSINGVAATANTGTGAVARAAGPTFTTPTLGVATATSINSLTITTSTGTLTITNSKVISFSNTLTFAGTDSTTMTFPSTSATIARTDAANTFTGHQTIEGVTTTGATGTGLLVFGTTPTLTTPVLGVATVTSLAAATNSSISMLSGTYNTIQTYTPSGAGTATLDLSKGNIHHITMPAGNITIAISNGTAGQVFLVRILQDSSGSRTVTWFTTIKWPAATAPTLTTGANKADTVAFEVTGSNTYDGFVIGQNL